MSPGGPPRGWGEWRGFVADVALGVEGGQGGEARDGGSASEGAGKGGVKGKVATTRWCRKCERPKPERAHHCRTCGKYV